MMYPTDLALQLAYLSVMLNRYHWAQMYFANFMVELSERKQSGANHHEGAPECQVIAFPGQPVRADKENDARLAIDLEITIGIAAMEEAFETFYDSPAAKMAKRTFRELLVKGLLNEVTLRDFLSRDHECEPSFDHGIDWRYWLDQAQGILDKMPDSDEPV
ncbi:MAG: hypothetical protein ABIA47_03885 [bacterium]